ncbi:MAG: hypothetical protein QG565_192 [Campylobacterota bacterium]|nr:hypothetical protein [Campylobacterota bacterium]MDQ1268220.1 hypothetical protein [Campylobacterota bacterium]
MNKFLVSILLVFIFTSLAVDAAVYKGQSEYVKKCVKCHKAGQAFVATKKKREWSTLMKDKGQKLAEIHLESEKKDVEESHEYFESKTFTKNTKHLKDFLLEYASDSGNVPACN